MDAESPGDSLPRSVIVQRAVSAPVPGGITGGRAERAFAEAGVDVLAL
ncbi:hypothetical protein [Azospirillum sp. SYSU D00513]|nr:hypothetical protein [Azospirillum sp. SYSU D00513]